jgi:dipeptidyl aminopeptidase/acylaminoacyl peptidase
MNRPNCCVERTLLSGGLQQSLLIVVVLGSLFAPWTQAQTAKRHFTVTDDAALSYLGNIQTEDPPFIFSPDHRFISVLTQHGRLDLNRPESVVRVYRSDDIAQILSGPQNASEPAPMWEIRESTGRHGPNVTQLHWLRDSSGFAFLTKSASGNSQLVLADLGTKTVHRLTNDAQYVKSFDIRTKNHFVYTVLAPPSPKQASSPGSAIIGTGKDLDSLMFPEESAAAENSERCELWAVVGDRRFKVKDPASSRALTLYWRGQHLALSPDGTSVVTVSPLDEVPREWEKLYPQPPVHGGEFKVQAGQQDLESLLGWGLVDQFALIDLRSGKIQSIVEAPTATSAGWLAEAFTDWSSDGQSLVVSGIFVPTGSQQVNPRPCIAVVEIKSLKATCLESIYGVAGDESVKWHDILRVHFAPGSDSHVTVDSMWDGNVTRFTNYTRGSNGTWNQDAASSDETRQQSFALTVKQGLNEPPVLVATDRRSGVARVILDPNPRLRDIALGEVSVFRWKAPNGHNDVGGLFKPPDYIPGRRYPLVIQTHGFVEDQFIPSGAFPTATAAQELAANGMLVLQARGEACPWGTPEEGPCAAENYEAAAKELIKAGMADPEKLGIVGFSATCYYVLQELTTGALHFKAASITDGADYGYFQYVSAVDNDPTNLGDRYAEGVIGAAPFGEGLATWLKRSPAFKMDKVETPLQVVALGTHAHVLSMWEPYATLRYLGKPVDFMIIPNSEHVITNPGEQMISQGATVDWFRFWLKGEEDPDPAKAQQYARWRGLRDIKTTHSQSAAQLQP